MSRPAAVNSAVGVPAGAGLSTQQQDQTTELPVQSLSSNASRVADVSCHDENKDADGNIPAYTTPLLSLGQPPLLPLSLPLSLPLPLSSAPAPQRAAFVPTQQTSQRHPAGLRIDQDRMADMLARGEQCNIIAAPILADFIVPADIMDLSCMHLEVDETNSGGDEEYIPAWTGDNLMTLRRAGGPEGIRKRAVPRYNTAHGVAMQCRNLVRSRPRMRRRKQTLHDELHAPGASSSAATASGPVLSPPTSPTLFPM